MVNIVDSPFRVRAKDRKISINTMQKEGIFVQKLRKMQKNCPNICTIQKKTVISQRICIITICEYIKTPNVYYG